MQRILRTCFRGFKSIISCAVCYAALQTALRRVGLQQWIKRSGKSARQLSRDTGVSMPVIARACNGRASLRNAIVLHRWTGVPLRRLTQVQVPDGVG